MERQWKIPLGGQGNNSGNMESLPFTNYYFSTNNYEIFQTTILQQLLQTIMPSKSNKV